MAPLLFNERVDTLSMTEDLGVVRRMKTKARITGLTTLSSRALQEAYNMVGLPEPGSYYESPDVISIFSMLVLVRRDFDLIDESTVDVVMSWEHFLDGDNQQLSIKGSAGRKKIYGKTRTSVQQTKVNYYPIADPGIRKWPAPGESIGKATSDNVDATVRNYVGTQLGGFTKAAAIVAVGNALAAQAVMIGNCVEYNGFYWYAERPIFIRTDGSTIPSTVNLPPSSGTSQTMPTATYIRGDPPPGPMPLDLVFNPLIDDFVWPVDTYENVYTDPISGQVFGSVIPVPVEPAGLRYLLLWPGSPNAVSPISPFNNHALTEGWPWRLALEEAVRDPNHLVPIQQPDVIFPETNYNGDAPVIIRRPIAVGHTFPLTDRQLKGQTFYQTGEVSIMQPHKTYCVQGFVLTENVTEIEDALIGKVNKVAWRDGDARMWLCTSVQSEPLFTGVKSKLSVEFQKNLDTWDPTAVFNDQRTGRPPANLIPGFGTRQDIPFSDELDFDGYFSATFEA